MQNPDDPRNEGDQLMLLQDVSGAFRPHKLTCLMGASGAGKTTLMDCLAGRKTSIILYLCHDDYIPIYYVYSFHT